MSYSNQKVNISAFGAPKTKRSQKEKTKDILDNLDIQRLNKKMPMATLAGNLFSNDDDFNISSAYYETAPDEYKSPLHNDFPLQLELKLENAQDTISEMKKKIEEFERAHEKMALYALKWISLQNDLEHDASLKQMFDNIQMLRKLCGSKLI